MGVFTTHTTQTTSTTSTNSNNNNNNGGGSGGGGGDEVVSKWVGTGYALTSRMYEGIPLEEHDILIANGTLPNGVGRWTYVLSNTIHAIHVL